MSLRKIVESKESKIRRLDLTDEQKETLINLFNKYNYLESKIDWNNSNLTWEDFKDVLDTAGKSRSSQKKYGIEGLVKGKDYIDFGEGYNDRIGSYRLYQPLTYEGSKVLASNKVPPIKDNGAQWCIAYQKTSQYWFDYIEKQILFLFVLTEDTKYAITLYPTSMKKLEDERIEVYSFEDKNLGLSKWCITDKTIARTLKKLQSIKCIKLCPKFEFTKNSDGTYDYKVMDISNEIRKYKKEGYEINVRPQKPSNKTMFQLLIPYIKNGELTIQLNRWETSFLIPDLPSLKSLKGVPRYVKGDFSCKGTPLVSSGLKGAPEVVDGFFECTYCRLRSLKGAPKKVGSGFYCSQNRLTSLKGAPEYVGGEFNCADNELTSLKGAPKYVGGDFNCKYNDIISLEGAPEEVNNFFCTYNPITSLKGAPKYVREDFYLDSSNLEDIEGRPKEVECYVVREYGTTTALLIPERFVQYFNKKLSSKNEER